MDYYRQGKHVKTETIITQESFQARLRSALRDMNDHDRHPLRFQTSLNDPDGLLKEFGSSRSKVSVRTAERWLKFLGFMPTTASKGWFTDGHEREDIVQHRTEFLVVMEILERRMRHWSGPQMDQLHLPELAEEEKEVVIVTHDESTYYCNEGLRIFWMENGKKKLLPKSRGV